MAWEFKREESENNLKTIPEGIHKVRIASVDKAVSQNANDMIKFKLDVSGYPGYLFTQITFLPDKPQITNRMLTQFYDAFKDIPEGSLDMQSWVGKIGACKVKHEEYNGSIQAKVHYFVEVSRQGSLPPWKEPERKGNSDSGSSSAGSENGFLQVTDEDVENLGFF